MTQLSREYILRLQKNNSSSAKSGGGGGVGGGASQSWVDSNYIGKEYLAQAFLTYNGSTLVEPNDTTTGIDKLSVLVATAFAGAVTMDSTLAVTGNITMGSKLVATQEWTGQNYVSIAFFSRLFQAYNGNTAVNPNDTTTTIDSIKAMFGFWTEFYVTALGNGGHAGSAIYLSQLADVNVAGVQDGQALVWNQTQGKWVAGSPTSGTVTSVGMSVPTGFSISGSPVTGSGTLGLTFASGYSLPLTDDVAKGVTAYNNLSGYLPLTGGTLSGTLIMNGITGGNWDEGIRINLASNGWATMTMGGNASAGTGTGIWSFHVYASDFYLSHNGSSNPTYGLAFTAGGSLNFKTSALTNNGYPIITSNNWSSYIGTSSAYVGYANYATSAGSASTATSAGYATSAGNADTLDSIHANGLLTDVSSSWSTNLSVTVGGKTLSASTVYANYAQTLRYSRTLWGQSFNGSDNVSGDMSSVGDIQCRSGSRIYGGGGNLYLGNSDNSAYVLVQDICSQLSAGDTYWCIHQSGSASFQSVYSVSYVTALSDMRKKDVVDYFALDIHSVANAPMIHYRWKDGNDDLIHVGSSAQYWQTLLPEAVPEAKGFLSMDYGKIALIAAISTARKVVELEERVRQLESMIG